MSSWRLLVHEDVPLHDIVVSCPPIRQRLNLVLRHLALSGRTSIVKHVQGAARGWRRTPLGGNGGSHFYLWWAPAGTPPVEHLSHIGHSFIVVRAIRHHDQTSEQLYAGNVAQFNSKYNNVTLAQLAGADHSFANEEQTTFVNDSSSIRLLMGHPGTGKTTALHESIFQLPGGTVLYVTFNPALAMNASDFLRAASHVTARVVTLSQLLQLLTPGQVSLPEDPRAPLEAGVKRLHALLEKWKWQRLLQRVSTPDLYHELHACVFGKAVPDPEQPQYSTRPYLTEAEYRELHPNRYVELGDQLEKLAIRIVEHRDFERLFPLHAASRTVISSLQQFKAAIPMELVSDAIFVDEIQDLTLLEQTAIALLAKQVATTTGLAPAFVAAGDEAQVVRPTDFEWGPLHNLLSKHLGKPCRLSLNGNVRNPEPIVRVINNSWSLYSNMQKTERPRGYARTSAIAPVGGGVFYVPCPELAIANELVSWFSEPGRRAVHPDPFDVCILDRVSTTTAEKGLDYQHVAVIDAGRVLAGLSQKPRECHRAIVDGVRVAISRATETLVFVETSPTKEGRRRILELCREADCSEIGGRELLDYLQTLDHDEQDLISMACSEAENLLSNDPKRAWNQALLAATRGRQLRISGRSDAGLDNEIAQAITRCALIEPTAEKLARSVEELRSPHNDTLRSAIALLGQLFEQPEPLRGLTSLIKLREVLRALPNWATRFATAIEYWSNEAVRKTGSFVTDPDGWGEFARCLYDIGSEHLNPMLSKRARSILLTMAELLHKAGRYSDAFQLWKEQGVRSTQVADCLYNLGHTAEAAALYEELGAGRVAVDLWRELANTTEAVRVARSINAPEVNLLEQVIRIQDDLLAVADLLTQPEQEMLASKLLLSPKQPKTRSSRRKH